MPESLTPVAGQAGFFYPSEEMVDLGGGFYSTGDLVETAPGSGFYRSRALAPDVPAIRVFIDDAPCPRAEILIEEFPAATVRLTLFRAAGGRLHPVPGALNTLVGGSWAHIDYEIPFGTAVTYRAQLFDEDGRSIGYTPASAPVTVDEQRTWIQNPLDPAGAVTMAFRGNALRDLSRPTDGEIIYPLGRRVGLVVAGQRRGLTDITLDVISDTLEQAQRFSILTGTYDEGTTTVPVLCVRAGSRDRVRIPRLLYASALNIHEVDFDYNLGGNKIAFAWSGDEVSRPTSALIAPTLTNADLRRAYPTNAAMAADNLTNLALSRRYDLSGRAA
ncbi:hypothetical protein C5B94_04010 [Clavibacter michiganensis]|uniref:hypothetical protein n=1 Tax=Clavibacter michiganensis TaxID=28447 RepID=UPI000CE826AC|nr:hypothetical protein [Clavibacter michiganensis]PPF56094.1 hypothetical protein C5B94_04010 [Clavibacter michiganensis]